MDSRQIGKQATEILGIMMIGEGVIGLVNPDGHLRLWKGWSTTMDRWIDAFRDRPVLMRLIGATEVLAGLTITCAVLPGRCEQARLELPRSQGEVETEVFEAAGQI